MSSGGVLVATVPGMISLDDLSPIRALTNVDYFEGDSISEEALANKCKGFDVLMLNYDIVKHLGESFYEHPNVKKLRSISTDITGMDWASPSIAAKHGVLLQNTPHYSTESVAETILAEVLLHSRSRLLSFRDEIAKRDVQSRSGINLLGRTAGIVGYGSIGSRVAELLSAFGMQVNIWNRRPRPGITVVSLDTIFKSSQVICLCVATELTGPEANKGFIGAALLSQCSDAILINLASEHLVDVDAVAAALRDGKLRGYSVERSKKMLNASLASIENVHLAPSNSWKSPESLQTLKDIWVSNTISTLNGKPDNIFQR